MLWDVKNGNRIRTFDGLQDAVTFVAFTSDGKRLAAAAGRDGIVFWDVVTGKKLRSVGASDEQCFSVLSPDWKTAVTVAHKGQASILNVESGQTVRRIGPLEEEWSVPRSFSPDGKLLVIASALSAELWDTQTGKKKCQLRCSGRGN
jgi:WD40 repeat protein